MDTTLERLSASDSQDYNNELLRSARKAILDSQHNNLG